jgi:hypothetical protein
LRVAWPAGYSDTSAFPNADPIGELVARVEYDGFAFAQSVLDLGKSAVIGADLDAAHPLAREVRVGSDQARGGCWP